MNAYFQPKVNETYEIYKFRNATQNSGESLDIYFTRLRRLAQTCEFDKEDEEIKSHIAMSCLSSRLRRRALREDMDLKVQLDYGRGLEMSEMQAKGIEKQQKLAKVTEVQTVKEGKRSPENKKCYRCGENYPHKGRPCPALNGVYRETTMDVIFIHLPAPGNVEPILHFMYSGIADGALLQPSEIFNTIQNANFLGVDELLAKTAESFAARWKVFALSPLFRRSIVDSEFVASILEIGTKNNVFSDGDKLRIVVLWNEEEEDLDSNLPESTRLLLEHKCFKKTRIVDL